jgi:predicted DsbA family dithiol-disulfide isomerase
MKVELTMDVICAWSYMGFTRFERAAARHRARGGEIEVTFRPFELAPGAPTDGIPLLDALRFAMGENAPRDAARVAEIAAYDGLELNHGRAIATGTFEAHRLIALASAQGQGEKMAERLFRAHFTDGLHIGDTSTLQGLAAEVGVTWDDSGADETLQELARVRREGITAVPVFRFEDGTTLSGAQPEAALSAALESSR